MKEYNVWNPISSKDVPSEAKIIISIYSMKKKSNGNFQAILNARGYEKVKGVHCDRCTIYFPVTNYMIISLALMS